MPDNYTSLLLHGDLDIANNVRMECRGNFSIVPEGNVGKNCFLNSDGKGKYFRIDYDDYQAAGLDPGDDDFTLEMWIYFTDGGYHGIFTWGIDSYSVRTSLYISGTDLSFYSKNGSGNILAKYIYDWDYNVGQWYHLALVRDGSDLRLYIDGQQKTWTNIDTPIGTKSLSLPHGEMGIPSARLDGGQRYLEGKLEDVHLSIGIARYDSNFSVPTTKSTADAYTKLLLDFDSFGDKSSYSNTVTNVDPGPNMTIAPSSKFGSSYEYDGLNTSYVSVYQDPSAGDLFDLSGSDPFCMECWAYFKTDITGRPILRHRSSDTWYWVWMTDENDDMRFYFKKGAFSFSIDVDVAEHGMTVNNWYHLAISRDSSMEWRFFVNGVQKGSTTLEAEPLPDIPTAYPILVGVNETELYQFNGYIDEVRISKGVPRYTENFTPPVAPFGDYKISGVSERDMKIFVIDRDRNGIEREQQITAGAYEILNLYEGEKLIVGEDANTKETVSYGGVQAVPE